MALEAECTGAVEEGRTNAELRIKNYELRITNDDF
jgi:hypothetical protein